jgi:hypothetical protein
MSQTVLISKTAIQSQSARIPATGSRVQASSHKECVVRVGLDVQVNGCIHFVWISDQQKVKFLSVFDVSRKDLLAIRAIFIHRANQFGAPKHLLEF